MIGRFLRTVRHLRPTQIGHRAVHVARLRLDAMRPPDVRWAGIEPQAGGDWNHAEKSKLWRYERQYHDEVVALAREGAVEEAKRFVASWAGACPRPRGDAWEPYPVARRVLNWALASHLSAPLGGFLARGLRDQARFLAGRVEWHLLGNHVLCDAAALAAGGLPEGAALLARELPRQVLPDGGYAERTAQYHSIVLRDVLLALALSGRKLAPVIEECTRHMALWLAQVARGDEIPFLNDAAPGATPTVSETLSLARALGFIDGPWDSWLGRAFGLRAPPGNVPGRGDLELPDTGWSLVREGGHELLFEHGPIGPDEQPGHGHSDALSYELIWDGHPVVVDTGVTTYDTDETRAYERSAAAHACVTVGGEGPDELWAAFRVGARAKVQGRRVARGEFEGLVRAPAGWEHRRTLRFVPGKSLTVRDEVRNGRGQVRSHIPLAPGCALDANGALSFGGGKLALRVLHGTRAAEVPGWVGRGFDKREPRQVAAIEAGPDGIVEYSMAMP